MRIIFVRHGHPDYSKDCLTEMGHLQAQAAAKRLCDEKIDKIYSSTCGRAFETAQHIAAVHGFDIEQLDFMREISWGSVDENPIPHDGHPWYTADDMAAKGQCLLNNDWDKIEPFCKNKVIASAKYVAESFDGLMETLGYKREENFYRVGKPCYDNVLVASHGGSSSVVLAHLFNLPLPFVFSVYRPDFTCITIIEFNGDEGCLVAPKIELLNDSTHIANLGTEKMFGR